MMTKRTGISAVLASNSPLCTGLATAAWPLRFRVGAMSPNVQGKGIGHTVLFVI